MFLKNLYLGPYCRGLIQISSLEMSSLLKKSDNVCGEMGRYHSGKLGAGMGDGVVDTVVIDRDGLHFAAAVGVVGCSLVALAERGAVIRI